MDVWHAVETLNNSFVVCHYNGVIEVDFDGRLIRECHYTQFLHPCHLAAIDGTLFTDELMPGNKGQHF